VISDSSLEETFTLELVNPIFSTAFRQVVLVILIAHESNELAITLCLASTVFIAFDGCEPAHCASTLLELVIELTSGIAVVLHEQIRVLR
jgi:hypothetical protein